MENFNLTQVSVTDGFWAEKQKNNAEVSVQSIYDRFYETGRFAALKCKKEPHEAHVFWDSDIAKWLEAAAYLLRRKKDDKIFALYNEAVEDIVNGQAECGYFNSFFLTQAPDKIFTDRTAHELYCAGHIFEAAVAAKQYLNDDRLLGVSSRYVDYIRKRFMEDRDVPFVTPGHEEIELALFRLYELTKEEKYRETAQFFLDERGTREEQEYDFADHTYSQSHLPVREQMETYGHAVRMLYLMSAMADSARISNDPDMQKACEALFSDIVEKKMYVTGGVGSTHAAERFSLPYDLPNATAYSETCASIALVLFCDRMIRLTGEAKYGDVLERALYNGVLAGVSLSGDSFFYVNPLEVNKEKVEYNRKRWGINRESVPILERVKVFDCSCCPPNVARIVEEIPSFIWYAEKEKGEILLSQPVSSRLDCDWVEVEVSSSFPFGGKVSVKIDSKGKPVTLKIRKPAWTTEAFDGEENGFLVFRGVFGGESISLDFKPTVRRVYAHPAVGENALKTAFTYGPLVFAAESVDNPENLFAVRVKKEATATVSAHENADIGLKMQIPALLAEGNGLYSYSRPKEKEITLTLIPYNAWANRGANDMKVWIPEE